MPATANPAAPTADRGFNDHLIGVPGSRARLNTPALVLDLDALERNIAAMAAHVSATGQRLRPHAKTHKSVEIARRQIAAGAVGISCATLGEAEAMVAGGIPGVLVTSPVVQPDKIARLVALDARAEGLMAVVDHPDNVAALDAAAGQAGRRLKLVVDVDVGTHRTGVASAQLAVALARDIAGRQHVEFAGVQGYAGHLQHVRDFAERGAATRAMADWLAQVREQLAAAGLPPPFVTGGGTGTHDLDHRAGVLTELQAGSYVFMDVDYAAVHLAEAEALPFETALRVRASVVSLQDGQAVTDAGLKAFATDGPKPALLDGAPAGAVYGWGGDEHGRVLLPPGATPLALGAAVECQVPHCDPTVNLYDHYHVVRGDMLVDIWAVDARGRR